MTEQAWPPFSTPIRAKRARVGHAAAQAEAPGRFRGSLRAKMKMGVTFQSFRGDSRPEQGRHGCPLRKAIANRARLTGFVSARADAHQAIYVAPADDRLKLADRVYRIGPGFCGRLADVGGPCSSTGGYRRRVRPGADVYTPVACPRCPRQIWLAPELPQGGIVGIRSVAACRRQSSNW